MTTPALPAWVPGVYYYETRYARAFERAAHLLKFWLLFPLLLAALAPAAALRDAALPLALLWLSFLNLYDLGCFENDHRAVAREAAPTRRPWARAPDLVRWRRAKLVLAAALLAAVAAATPAATRLPALALLAATALVFALHNRLPAAARPLTLAALYAAKGLLFAMPLLPALAPAARVTYLAFCLLLALSYTPAYTRAKTRARATGAPLAPWRRALLQPLFWKHALLAPLALREPAVLLLLAWIDVVTAFEYKLGRRLPGE